MPSEFSRKAYIDSNESKSVNMNSVLLKMIYFPEQSQKSIYMACHLLFLSFNNGEKLSSVVSHY